MYNSVIGVDFMSSSGNRITNFSLVQRGHALAIVDFEDSAIVRYAAVGALASRKNAIVRLAKLRRQQSTPQTFGKVAS